MDFEDSDEDYDPKAHTPRRSLRPKSTKSYIEQDNNYDTEDGEDATVDDGGDVEMDEEDVEGDDVSQSVEVGIEDQVSCCMASRLWVRNPP